MVMDLVRYVDHEEPVDYPAGTVIFRQGDRGDVMYIVKQGEVQLTYGLGQTTTVGPGSSFGEMALIDRNPRSADASAATDVQLYPVNQRLFFVLLHDTPYFALEVMKSLSDRLRRANGALPPPAGPSTAGSTDAPSDSVRSDAT
jgi:CRP/FNR family cyclic AMP-dependent transcriptional regulator